MTDAARAAAGFIRNALPDRAPALALMLGSGLDQVAAALSDTATLDYRKIPGFPRPGVRGHRGRLVFGRIGTTEAVCLQGRVHLYEGGDPARLRTLVRAMKWLGCRTLLITNAVGGLHPDLAPGALMLVIDHLNLQGTNPLVGRNDDQYGARFPDFSAVYDRGLRSELKAAARLAGVALSEGVYGATLGPGFETPAEIRAFRGLGVDAVGMSLVPEAIIAHHAGLRVAAVSVVTNRAAGLHETALSHAETLDFGARAVAGLSRLFTTFVERHANQS